MVKEEAIFMHNKPVIYRALTATEERLVVLSPWVVYVGAYATTTPPW